MKNKGPSPKLLIAAALGVVLLGAGAIYWQFSLKQGATARVQQLEEVVPDEAELNAELAASEEALDEASIQLAHLESGIPTVAYVPTLLKELEQVGVMSDVKVTGVRPLPPTATPPGAPKKQEAYTELDIDISGRGTYSSIMTMVDQLADFPKIIAVKTVSMAPQAKAGNAGAYEYIETQVRLKAFVFPENTPEPEAVASLMNEGASS